jgi:hypothetical protein
MNTPAENVAEVNRPIAEVRAHSMRVSWRDEAGIYVVIYPDGYWPEGVQADHEESNPPG